MCTCCVGVQDREGERGKEAAASEKALKESEKKKAEIAAETAKLKAMPAMSEGMEYDVR